MHRISVYAVGSLGIRRVGPGCPSVCAGALRIAARAITVIKNDVLLNKCAVSFSKICSSKVIPTMLSSKKVTTAMID